LDKVIKMKTFEALTLSALALVVAATLASCASVGADGMRLAEARPGAARPADGLISLASPHGAKATMDRLEASVRQKQLTVFARIDHAAGAATIGASLRPTELLVFGNPQGGTPLMQCAQTAGIDLPLKVLVWEDASAKVWLSYNDPAYIAQRHRASNCPAVQNLSQALSGLANAATAP
jgi:uncharacterized protein (DUF302 family)